MPPTITDPEQRLRELKAAIGNLAKEIRATNMRRAKVIRLETILSQTLQKKEEILQDLSGQALELSIEILKRRYPTLLQRLGGSDD
jgi:hypothetical protein